MKYAVKILLSLLLIGCWGLITDDACAVEKESAERLQISQQKAFNMTRDLVSGILELQMRQLHENGLKDLPIYGEIQTMRKHLDELVRDEMPAVVRLLIEAQQGNSQQRLAKHSQAQDKIQEVILHLMAQRQQLRRRLQMAQLASQIRELIELQQKGHSATIELPNRALPQRDLLAVSTIKQQQLVKKLYVRLMETLHETSRLSGDEGAGAADGLRLVRAAQIEKEIDRSEKELQLGQYSQAASHQQAVLDGLRALLERIDEARGLGAADRQAALDMVTGMLGRQRALHNNTRDSKSFEQDTDRFVEQQTRIHKDLGKLSEALQSFPSGEGLMQQAKGAAFQAVSDLFSLRKPQALAEQTKVIKALQEIQQQLRHAIDSQRADKSAKELEEEVKQLQQLKDKLQQIYQNQAEANKNAASNLKVAQAKQQQVSDQLAKTLLSKNLPGTIKSRLTDAQEAVQRAQQELTKTKAETRQQATENASDALQQALAETKARLADLRRRQLAVEVGELARAAEALERAAAAENQIANIAEQAGREQGLSAMQAQQLLTKHRDVAKVAEKISQGVQRAAAEVSKHLDETSKLLKQVQNDLHSAQQHSGAPSKPSATSAAKSALLAAQQITDAAAMLRKQQGQMAEQLTRLADQQLQQISEVKKPVEQALVDAKINENQIIPQLEKAQSNIRSAKVELLRAQGRAAEADARKLANDVSDIIQKQQIAETAAAELSSGKKNSTLDAASLQQQVAESIESPLEQADPALKKILNEAASFASKAAKELLTGNPASAAEARMRIQAALQRAQHVADDAAEVAAKAPPTKLNSAAQSQVSTHAAAAEKHLGNAVPAAAEALKKSQLHSSAAEKQIVGADRVEAATQQKLSDRHLNKAAEQISMAQKQARAQQHEYLSRQSKNTRSLADQAAEVDPGAASALRRAGQSADQGSANDSEKSASQTKQAQDATKQHLQRAAASLVARDQKIRKDREIAEVVSKLAKEQQQARDEITKQSKSLEQLARQKSTSKESNQKESNQSSNEKPAPSPEQVAAAQALQSATQRFAEAQRATGQGAAEISRQQQVVNQPIREGLETASRLGGSESSEKSPGDQIADNSSQGEDQGKESSAGKDSEQPSGKDQGDGKSQGKKQGEGNKQGQGENGKPGDGKGDQQGKGQTNGDGEGLGTGLVPSSPEATAKQIAGSEALAQAAQTLAQAKGQGKGKAQGEQANQGDNKSPSKDGGDAAQGDSSSGPPNPKAPLSPDSSARGDNLSGAGPDSAAVMQQFEQQPWFTNLPPELREAIRANARKRPPRGYEERLRRYFQSAD